MGQVLHACATTTHAIRKAIQRSEASVSELAEQYAINQKTVRKWRARKSIEDAPMGPKNARSTSLLPEDKQLALLFVSTHCCRWMIVFTRCKTVSRI